MPSRSTSSSCASATVNMSSDARSSTSSPPARSCGSLSAGSVREITISRTFAGSTATAWLSDAMESACVTRCMSSSTSATSSEKAARLFASSSTEASIDRPNIFSVRIAGRPRPGRIRSTAVGDGRPEPHGIVVVGIEPHPGEPGIPACAPRPHRGRLPVSRRCRNERQRGCALVSSASRTRDRSINPARRTGAEIFASARGSAAAPAVPRLEVASWRGSGPSWDMTLLIVTSSPPRSASEQHPCWTGMRGPRPMRAEHPHESCISRCGECKLAACVASARRDPGRRRTFGIT